MLCHANPTGGGPLTNYGRAVGAVAISDNLWPFDKYTDEQLAEYSSFFKSDKLTHGAFKKVQPGASFRGIYFYRTIGKEGSRGKLIPMDASANLIYQFDKASKFIFVGSVSYYPSSKPSSKLANTDYGNLVTRDHLIVYKHTKEIRIVTGMTDKFYGIKIPDHVAFSRSITGNSQNDQVHGVGVHVIEKAYEISSQLFIGNLFQSPDFREKGNATTIQYNPSELTSIGVTGLISQNKIISKNAKGIVGKLGLKTGNALLLEIGNVEKKQRLINMNKTSEMYGFLQGFVKIKRGLYGLNTFEFYRSDIKVSGSNTIRITPGLQYFPFPGSELRIEFSQSKRYMKNMVTEDSFDFMGQVHLWF